MKSPLDEGFCLIWASSNENDSCYNGVERFNLKRKVFIMLQVESVSLSGDLFYRFYFIFVDLAHLITVVMERSRWKVLKGSMRGSISRRVFFSPLPWLLFSLFLRRNEFEMPQPNEIHAELAERVFFYFSALWKTRRF